MHKQFKLFLIISLIAASSFVIVQPISSSESITTLAENSWSTKSSMLIGRNCKIAVWNETIYAIGGFTPHGFINATENYNPATDVWSSKASMPTSRDCFAIAVYENKIYCIGGRTTNGVYTGANEVYDPIHDKWENKTAMLMARASLTASVVNDKIYLIGGEPNEYLNEVYDPKTNCWETKEPVLMGATDHASAVVDNKIYVLGGYTNGTNNQIFDPQTNSWSLGKPLPTRALYASCGVISGIFAQKAIYVFAATEPESFFGESSQRFVTEIYNLQNDMWIVGKPIPSNRIDFDVAVVQDMIYVIGGHSYVTNIGYVSPSDKNEQYTPIGYHASPFSIGTSTPTLLPSVVLSTEQIWSPVGLAIILVIATTVISCYAYYKKLNKR